jgi:hypothetical protein
MNILHESDVLAAENLDAVYEDLKQTVLRAVREHRPMHAMEKAVWEQLLRLGRAALTQVFTLLGNGNLGETVTLPDGRQCQRLEQEHARRYVSIFGDFVLSRVVYGSREGQKIEFVPLDHHLQLPASAFSYLLQDWDQSLCVEQAFGQARTTVQRMLGLQQSVDSLEHMNQEMAQGATNFVLQRPAPAAETEGEVVVASADQKGIVLRRSADHPPPKAHRTKGDKASQKRMATVATVYTVDRYPRTPAEVVAALFRDAPAPARDRPSPQHKEVWASLPRAEVPGSGIDRAFAWMIGELYLRGRGKDKNKPLVFLSDGQEALWTACAEWLPERTVGILDVLHVTPRLWQAAHVFHAEGSPAAEAFVRDRLLRVLQGQAAGVLRGLREMGTKRRVVGAKKRTLTTVCHYLEANLARMHCTVPGAQAMLDVRSIYVSGLWEEYQEWRIARATAKLYPYRTLVEQSFAMAA